RRSYQQVEIPSTSLELRCCNHEGKLFDDDGEVYFKDIKKYVTDGTLPKSLGTDAARIRAFICKTDRFFVHDDRLWRHNRNGIPQLIIIDCKHRRQLLAEAHNDCGHRGRDPTY
ncbi:hypothetical protein BKA93DRAFT_692778, partial [Sparassis latifolia]